MDKGEVTRSSPKHQRQRRHDDEEDVGVVVEKEEEEKKSGADGVRRFPKEFEAFLERWNIDRRIYDLATTIPRYIRLKEPGSMSAEELSKEFANSGGDGGGNGSDVLVEETHVKDFFQLPADINISATQLYKQGRIYGIDLSSGVSVLALDVQESDHVLDLCCAPGGKLCFIGDILSEKRRKSAATKQDQNQEQQDDEEKEESKKPSRKRHKEADAEWKQQGSVTGVDINQERLASCRTMVLKYKVMNVRLICSDGTTFNERPPTAPIFNCRIQTIQSGDTKIALQKRKKSKKDRFHSQPVDISDAGSLYDKVLVDAECTHDGSVKHIVKFDRLGWSTFEEKFLNQERLSNLEKLQRGLISNGYRLLKPGGTLVYSTCSFCRDQNEDIVEWLLNEHPETASLESLPESLLSSRYREGLIPKTYRFDPLVSNTSGLFVAKIKKAATISPSSSSAK